MSLSVGSFLFIALLICGCLICQSNGQNLRFRGRYPVPLNNSCEFPDDDRFIERIKSSDLYHRKLCVYVLEEYERSFTRGDVLKSFPPITVDHVMPQSRSGEWLNVVSEEEHQQYLHTWANLVPLSDKANSEKGSKSWFEVKQKLQHETVFSTTKSLIANHDEWGIDEIESRADTLANWAVKRWPK